MLDIKFIRQNPEKVREKCKSKGFKVEIEKILELDEKKRATLKSLENLRAQKNRISKELPRLKDEKEKEKIIAQARQLDNREKELEERFKETEKELKKLLFNLPNLPLDSVPKGKDEEDNVVLREVGKKPVFDFQPLDHLEIGESLDIIDVKRATKISGTRFGILKREAVWLELALLNWAFEKLTKKGFIPLLPPVMLKREMAQGTGYFEATDEKEAYFIPSDNFFLAGTAEQPIIAMHTNEVFEEKELPKRYVGFSSCFRREAGSWGKDTRGIFRVHQFDKIEMISFCKPQDSEKEHQFFLDLQEELMRQLKLPYRVVQICTGDLSFPSAASFDIETWFPSQGRFRETHSTSNCTDFQARRLNIRYRDRIGKLNFVHTINGTAFSQRPILAILENCQQKDGSIKIPKILQKRLPFKRIKR